MLCFTERRLGQLFSTHQCRQSHREQLLLWWVCVCVWCTGWLEWPHVVRRCILLSTNNSFTPPPCRPLHQRRVRHEEAVVADLQRPGRVAHAGGRRAAGPRLQRLHLLLHAQVSVFLSASETWWNGSVLNRPLGRIVAPRGGRRSLRCDDTSDVALTGCFCCTSCLLRDVFEQLSEMERSGVGATAEAARNVLQPLWAPPSSPLNKLEYYCSPYFFWRRLRELLFLSLKRSMAPPLTYHLWIPTRVLNLWRLFKISRNGVNKKKVQWIKFCLHVFGGWSFSFALIFNQTTVL